MPTNKQQDARDLETWRRMRGFLPLEDLKQYDPQPLPHEDLSVPSNSPPQKPTMQVRGSVYGAGPMQLPAKGAPSSDIPGMPKGWHPPMARNFDPNAPLLKQFPAAAPATPPPVGKIPSAPIPASMPPARNEDWKDASMFSGSGQAEFVPSPNQAPPTGDVKDLADLGLTQATKDTPGAVPVPEGTPIEAIPAIVAKGPPPPEEEAVAEGSAPTSQEDMIRNAIAQLHARDNSYLRPLAAWSDSMSGGKILGGFDEAGATNGPAAQLQAALLNAQNSRLDNVSALAKAQLMAAASAANTGLKTASTERIAAGAEGGRNTRQGIDLTGRGVLQGAQIASNEKIASEGNISKEKRAVSYGGAQGQLKQDNRNEDKRVAQERLDVDRSIQMPSTVPYKQHEVSNLAYNVLDKYIKAVEAATPAERLAPGAKRDDITQAYGEYLIAQKTSDNLGVLAGPDVGILKQELPDASAYGYNISHRGDSSSSLDIARKKQAALGRSMDRYVRTLRATYPGERTNEVIKIREDAGFEFRPRPASAPQWVPPFPGAFGSLTPEQREANKASSKAHGLQYGSGK